MLSWIIKNWFLAALFLSVGLAFLFPEAGATEGILRTEITTKLAVALLFFIRGTLLPLAELKRGALGWRLHLLVHAYIFLLLPFGVFLLFEIADVFWVIDPTFRLGFLFLAALPTTISTAAVFTSLAGGNTAGAVFNATLSNCLGVILVPLWVAWLLQREAAPLPVGPVILQIMLLVVVPLAAGQIVKPVLWEFSARHRWGLEVVSSVLVLFVIFAAFANSVVAGLWRDQAWEVLMGGFVVSLAVFVVATFAALAGGRIARLKRADRICLLFCGPQKTLAGGVTIANVIFPGEPALTLILLPVLFYHFIQLFAGGFFIGHLRKADSAEPKPTMG